jgi:hypothetical protein
MKIHVPLMPPPTPPKAASPAAWVMEQIAREELERTTAKRRAQKVTRLAASKDARKLDDTGNGDRTPESPEMNWTFSREGMELGVIVGKIAEVCVCGWCNGNDPSIRDRAGT